MIMSKDYKETATGTSPIPAMSIELVNCALRTSSGRYRLEPTTLTFASGLVTAVVGPNGAGKSSLLAIAAATLSPTEGEVLFGGYSVSDMNARQMAQSRAVLAQDLSVAFGFNAIDVVSWGRTPWRGTERQKQDSTAIKAALQSLGIIDLANRPMSELSGGERKRVHLARILAQETQCVLMDEPDSDLDLAGLATLDLAIQGMNALGKTMVISSHDLQRVSRLADRIVVVAEQKVVAHGEARAVITAEILSEAYKTQVKVQWTDQGVAHISIVG